MSAKQPNIVVFFWDNLGWGEVGCYGGGVLRGAPTPRITQYVSSLVRSHDELPDSHHGVGHTAG